MGTHGRSFWILDDLTPLHQVSDDIAGKSASLLQPRATQRILDSIDKWRLRDQPGKTYMTAMGTVAPYTFTATAENVIGRKFLDSGENPPCGVI